MRKMLAATLLAAVATSSAAQEATIVLPTGNFGNYNPTLSAKEAVLANWEMAASGVRAGEILGKQVVTLAEGGAGYKKLSAQADFALETIVARYSAAAWLFHVAPNATPVRDETLVSMVAAASGHCDTDDCGDATTAIRDAFAAASAELLEASSAARAEITARQGDVDAALLSEQLGMVADYLDSGAWGQDLVLSDFGMDADVMANRIVGALSLWRNIEPYVGLTDKEVDTAINTASTNLLRLLRRETRGMERLDPDGQVLVDLKAAAGALAAEYRRASALFAS